MMRKRTIWSDVFRTATSLTVSAVLELSGYFDKVRTSNCPNTSPTIWRSSKNFPDGDVQQKSRLGQPGSIPALVLPSGGMAVGHRKGATAERYDYTRMKSPGLNSPMVNDTGKNSPIAVSGAGKATWPIELRDGRSGMGVALVVELMAVRQLGYFQDANNID
ncbi:hypothetical protein CLF_104592 [Clonorchis sinensis]|uniref:Uncharacterized protein n=1 Tax=Clonorchis sinensis TaxID=79923 RepID=G7YBZ3_CLOSI|nr:hypothetical protein CLF_104592 [Clonorchis sinensis]